MKSREETIEQQKSDNKVVARNRRMFGALVGTLQKFNKEEIKKKDVLEKKKEVEKNVEEKVEKEKEEIKNKKRELFYEQKKKKKDIQIIQIQMKRVEEYEIWEKSKQFEGNFIRTKAEPDIYWLPKNHSEKTRGNEVIPISVFLSSLFQSSSRIRKTPLLKKSNQGRRSLRRNFFLLRRSCPLIKARIETVAQETSGTDSGKERGWTILWKLARMTRMMTIKDSCRTGELLRETEKMNLMGPT